MGNLQAALKYWNRIGKPSIAAFDFDPHLRVQRLLLDRAFAFSPAAVLREADFETTETRLTGLGIFPTYNIALNPRPEVSFDAQFRALERNGFGTSRVQALVSTFAGAPYETIDPPTTTWAGRPPILNRSCAGTRRSAGHGFRSPRRFMACRSGDGGFLPTCGMRIG